MAGKQITDYITYNNLRGGEKTPFLSLLQVCIHSERYSDET